MSADRQRLVGAIRRMVKSDPDIRDLLGGSKNKGDQAGTGAKAASQGEEERICCDGSTAPPNAGTSERDPDSGGQDASGGLDPNDPANLDMGAGSLTGLTDCATGEQVCFDGSGFIPPDGWDAPDEPALDPTYEAGYFWAYQDNTPGGGSISCCTIAPTKGGAEDRESICNPPGYFTLSKIECPGEGSGLCAGDIDRGCDPAMEDILATHWPSDGCVNLAVKGGTIVGSKYDPDQDGSYSKPLTEINLCDGAGNQIRLAPSADGGWKTLDAINGGDGYLYDSQGQQIARISGDEFSDPTI